MVDEPLKPAAPAPQGVLAAPGAVSVAPTPQPAAGAPVSPAAPIVRNPLQTGVTPAMPGAVQNAPAVELAGVPETPASVAGTSAAGPAVPSTDFYVTEGSPNKETSSEAPEPPVQTSRG